MGQKKKNKKSKKISGLFLRVFVLVFVVAVAVGIGRQAARYQEVKDETASVAAQVKEEKEKQWEFTIKMYCIIKDLMQGNPNLPAGFEEEKVGHNAIAAGFQGQRQWTDH